MSLVRLRRHRYITALLLVAIAVLAVITFIPASAKADSPNGWVVTSQEHQLAHQVPDGRIFVRGYANAINPRTGESGILLSEYRPGRPPERVAIPAAKLREYNPAVYTQKAWWNPLDWVAKAGKIFKSAIDKLHLDEVVKLVLEHTIDLLDEYGMGVVQDTADQNGGGDAGAQVVALHLSNVHAAAFTNATLAEKVAASHWATVSALPSRNASATWYAYTLATLDRK